MRFWVREAAGWALILLGLYIFWWCYLFLQGHFILEAGPLTFIGFVVFRGGIHLLKVAVAARICLQAQDVAKGARQGSRIAVHPITPVPRRS